MRFTLSRTTIYRPLAVAAAFAAGMMPTADLFAQPQQPDASRAGAVVQRLAERGPQFAEPELDTSGIDSNRASFRGDFPVSSSMGRSAASRQQAYDGYPTQMNARSGLSNGPSQAASLMRTQVDYQLRQLSMDQFEQRVVRRWGENLKTSTSADGRYVRAEFATVQGRVGMLVDRETGLISYEGRPDGLAVWQQLMHELDHVESVDGPASRLATADITGASPAAIQQVMHAMRVGVRQDPVPAGGNPQTETLPENTQLPQGTTQDDVIQGIQGLKNSVRVIEDPDTGAITLIGDPEDVAIVRREILRLSRQAMQNQPKVVTLTLSNAQSALIQETVQEIYDESYAAINGQAQISAIDTPNSLLVVGQPNGIKAIEMIVEQLDIETDVPPGSDFQTFELKYISANDARQRLLRFFGQAAPEQGENQIPSAAVQIVADYRSNQLIIRGGQQYLKQAEVFLAEIDVDKTDGAVNMVEVVRLNNALASEVALVIQNAINGGQPNANQAFVGNQQFGGGGQQQTAQFQQPDDFTSQLRSPQLSLRTVGKDGKVIDGGIMFDVRVTADTNSNSLVINAPKAAMPLVLELVEQLDVIPDAETQIKVFELLYGDAETLLGMLETLFGAGNQQFGGGGGFGQQGGNLNQLPLQAASQTDGATLVNLRFAIEPRSNAIIASGPAGDLQVVEDLLNRLDARALSQSKPRVYRLSNAPALDVAEAINNYIESRNSVIDTDPRTSTGVPAVNRAVIVTPEINSNSLIIQALPEYRREIEEIVMALDRRPPMIKVKTLIAEVDLSTIEEFGIELGIQDSLLFDRGTSIAADGALTGVGFPFNGPVPRGFPNNNAYARELVAGQLVSNLSVGQRNTNLGYGGLVLSAGNESISVLMRALKDRSCVRVLSKPHIMTMENLQGRVAIGASVPRVAGTTQSNFGTTQDIIFQDVGVILEVTPRVSPDGLIILSVNAEKSAVGPQETGITIGVSENGDPITSPQILKTEATTTLMARSGQTVVFSGLIEEEKVHTERGTPILSDLPYVGPLFKYESDTASRKELMIIMTPYLITDDTDVANQNQDEMDRMHWCLGDVAEVYGNTDFGGINGGMTAVETIYPDADPTGTQTPAQLDGDPMIDSRLETPGQPRFSQVPNESSAESEIDNSASRPPAESTSGRVRRGLFNRR